ncbi:MAG: aminotransferase class IV [Cytophagales bacterium]|nr:aminotransferase class IV [Cytophagales bacterium]
MAWVLYNDNYRKNDDVHLSIHERICRYGDGLFETMMCDNDTIKYYDYHWQRLHEGMVYFGFKPNASFTQNNVYEKVMQLIAKNTLQGIKTKIRLRVWRNGEGLYSPLENSISYLIECVPCTIPKSMINIGVSQCVQLAHTPYSKYKTCNSLPYIAAAVEKSNRNLDDLIITDNQGNISEAIASNIFWVKDGMVFTPSLQAGCIAGVMRRAVTERLKSSHIIVLEQMTNIEVLYGAEIVFLTNISGISYVAMLDHTRYNINLIIPYENILMNI